MNWRLDPIEEVLLGIRSKFKGSYIHGVTAYPLLYTEQYLLMIGWIVGIN